MYNKENYEKLKTENPEKLKAFRQTSYNNFKESNPERLAEIRRKASAKYYETHRELCIQRSIENAKKKHDGIVRPRGRPRKIIEEKIESIENI
jgi:hypothetical protein